VQIKLLFFGAL